MVWFNGQYLRLPEDEKGLPELARETMRRFYRVAVPPEEEVDAFKALVEFYTAGPQAGITSLFGSGCLRDLVEDVVQTADIVFVQPQTGGCPCAQDLVEAAHGNAGLCAETVAQADILPFAPGCLGLALPGHLVQCVLQTVEVVGVQKRKIKFLSMDQHLSVLLSLSPRRRCYSRTQPGCRCP